jgi:hypothetical protein
VVWAVDVAVVEVQEAEVRPEDEDLAIVEDVGAGAAWVVVEAFLVEAHPGVVEEAASEGGDHNFIHAISWCFGVRIYHEAFLSDPIAKAGLMLHSIAC